MLILVSGLTLFFIPHSLRELGLRDQVIRKLPSQNAYLGLYSIVSLVSIGLIVWGKASAPFSMVWQPIFQLRFISHVLMIPAFVLVVAGNTPTSYMKKQLRNPMVLGVTLWGFAHLWSNGDLASILLFGAFAVWGCFKFVALSLTQSSVMKEPSLLWDIISISIGLILYWVVGVYHGELFGIGLSLV